jgi:dihydrodipicolinate synthase/N-acetylneuraminate lyase
VEPHELRVALVNLHAYVATPFTEDFSRVREHDFATHLEDLYRRGVRVFAVGGGTGEADGLAAAEQARLAQVASETVGGRALVVGTLPGNFGEAVELARRYSALDLPVALAMGPMLRGRVVTEPLAVAGYYRRLATAVGLPLMPYNSHEWSLDVLLRLADIDSVVAIKDACINPHPMLQAIHRVGDQIVWVGNKRYDPAVTHLRYKLGMQAFTSGLANALPEPELELHAACSKGEDERAVQLQSMLAPFERLRAAADDAAAVKAAMEAMGYVGGAVRPPRLDLEAPERAEISRVLSMMCPAPS